MRIQLPKGTYVPLFSFRPIVASHAAPDYPIETLTSGRRWTLTHWLVAASGAVLITVVALTVVLLWRPSTGPAEPMHLRNFTSYPGYEMHPSISPDGKTIAFVWSGLDGANLDIYLQQADGDTPIRLTRHPGGEMAPVWSPDGREVAFLRAVSEGRYGIFSVPVSGAPERKWGEVAGIIAGAGR